MQQVANNNGLSIPLIGSGLWDRVYHVHIRKTGGTSLNHMFLALSGAEPDQLYSQLAADSEHVIRTGAFCYVGWNLSKIIEGRYFYAFSHIPFYELRLPQRTFTVTCLRDPVKRVISHYQMLYYYRANGVTHPCMPIEGDWLGKGFDDFLERIPKRALLNQLYMFSERFDVDEACAAVAKLNCIIFTDKFRDGTEKLVGITGIPLRTLHVRKQEPLALISRTATDKLRHMLAPEYKLMSKLTALAA